MASTKKSQNLKLDVKAFKEKLSIQTEMIQQVSTDLLKTMLTYSQKSDYDVDVHENVCVAIYDLDCIHKKLTTLNEIIKGEENE